MRLALAVQRSKAGRKLVLAGWETGGVACTRTHAHPHASFGESTWRGFHESLHAKFLWVECELPIGFLCTSIDQ